MADLTLYEYSDIPEEELREILQLESRKMFFPHSIEDNLKDKCAYVIIRHRPTKESVDS